MEVSRKLLCQAKARVDMTLAFSSSRFLGDGGARFAAGFTARNKLTTLENLLCVLRTLNHRRPRCVYAVPLSGLSKSNFAAQDLSRLCQYHGEI